MNIFVSGGKTMGHISPLISIILSLKDKYNFIYFGLEGSMEEEICKKYNIKFFAMKLSSFNREKILLNIKTFYLIVKEVRRIKREFKKVDNKAIISSGGFVSIPLFLALKSKKKILLESNTTMGLANKFLLSKANFLGVNFDTINHKKKVIVGNPIKINPPSFDHPFFYKDEKIILFIGGSNGAFEIVKAAYEFNQEYPNIKSFVITGKRYFDTFKFNDNVKVFERINDISSIFNKFDLIVSRAGAATITELMLSKCFFILVPSLNVSGNHQVLNAKYLESKGVCKVLYDISDTSYLELIYNSLFDEITKEKCLKNMMNIVIKDSIERIENLIENN